MKHHLSDKQCESIMLKHKISTTGYISKGALFAALREAFALGANGDVMHIKYKKEKAT